MFAACAKHLANIVERTQHCVFNGCGEGTRTTLSVRIRAIKSFDLLRNAFFMYGMSIHPPAAGG